MSQVFRPSSATDLKKIVLAGPPGVGKSTLIKMFREEMGEEIQCVPESPTMLITGLGLTPNTREGSFVHSKEFGCAMYHLQLLLENTAERIARNFHKKALLMDKARVDLAVHFLMAGYDLEEYERTFCTTLAADHEKYDLILFIDLPAKSVYERIRGNNAARGESYEDSLRLRDLYFSVWSSHSNFILIPNESSWEDCERLVRQIVNDFLSK